MAALTISTFGAFAQSETSQANAAVCEQTSNECSADTKECKKDKKDKKHCKKGERKGECKGKKGQRQNPFQGIELTADQQQQIDALRAEMKAAKEAGKKADKEAKAEARKQYDEKIAQILTPEQFTQYKANCDKMKDRKKGVKERVGKAKVKRDAKTADKKDLVEKAN